MSTRGLTVGLDARAAFHPQPGGFKTYTKNLIRSLVEVDSGNCYELYVDHAQPPNDLEASGAIHVRPLRGRLPVAGPAWREQVLLPAHATADRVDLLHCPAGTAPIFPRVPLVMTIHDALEQMPGVVPAQSPGRSPSRRRLMHVYNRYCQRLAADRAALIITVSEHSARDMSTYLGLPREKIRVVRSAAGPEFRCLSESESGGETIGGDEPFILAIGSADPRKNVAAVIRAYAALPSQLIARFRLVLVWTHDLLRDEVLRLARERGVGERITSVQGGTDDQLCRLYNKATVFVFPSLYEGFGLPPLEAMACGTPVIASDSSSLPEILGDAGLLVDPSSDAALIQALIAPLSDPQLRTELKRKGLARARRFSWRNAAAETVRVYEEVATLAAPAHYDALHGNP